MACDVVFFLQLVKGAYYAGVRIGGYHSYQKEARGWCGMKWVEKCMV